MHLVFGKPHESFLQFKACIFRRDNNSCQVCGDWNDLKIHYICDDMPNGGQVSENAITLCPRCKTHADAYKADSEKGHPGFGPDGFFSYIGTTHAGAVKMSEKLPAT